MESNSQEKPEIKAEELPQEANKNVEEAVAPSVIDSRLLKPGEYTLHIYIEETRGLVCKTKEASSTLDPLIKMQAFDISKHSKKKENRGSGMIYWGEHYFFTKDFSESSSFELEKLRLSVYDHNLLGADALIGEFELDLISIYFSEQHSLLHQWIALSNFKSNFEEIQGFLKFSANCVGPEDAQITLEDEEAKEDDVKDKKQKFSESALGPLASGRVLMPPQIHTKGWQLHIKLLKAENLVKMDNWGGSIDPYLVVSFGNVHYKTDYIKDNMNPVWGINIFLPFSEPSINDHVIFKIYDWDSTQNDELVGSSCFSKKDILTGKYVNLFWLNIYGSQSSGDSKTSALMNNNSALGTLWKGRILLSMEAYENDNPKLSSPKSVEPLPQELIDENTKLASNSMMEWSIFVELYYGVSFPSKNTEYDIELRWADQQLFFEKAHPQGNLWEWYIRKKMKCIFPYNKFEDLPDIFIYLRDGSNRISYLRYPASYFMNQLTEEANIYFLKPELSKNPDFKAHEAGIIKLRCALGSTDMFENLNLAGWNHELKKPECQSGYMLVNMYHAKNLIPADDDGASDPYYVLEYYGIEEKSEVIYDSLNPVWYKTHKMIVPFFKIDEMPPFIIKMFDRDTFKDEYIGHQIINLKEGIREGFVYFNRTDAPDPKWIHLDYDQQKKTAGKVLLSFNVLDRFPIGLPTISPAMDKYYVTLRILGLRNLKSLGLFEVKRPFIVFDINSLQPIETKQSLSEKKKIQTQPKETGSNPNLTTLISFEIDLPKDYSLCPTLNCVVYDCILKGFKQPVLGHFSIDLDVFIKASRERVKRKLKKYAHILAEKNEVFSKISTLIQKADVTKKPSISPKKEQGPKEIELSMEKDKGMQEPLLKPLSNQTGFDIIEDKNSKKLGYSQLDADKPEQILLDLEEPLRFKVIQDDGSIDSTAIVRFARYEYSIAKKAIVEINIPDPNKHLALGFDTKETRLNNPKPKRHYRYYIDEPLENTQFVDKKTFDEFDIYRGKRFTSDSLLSKLSGESKERSVGLFKGWIDIVSKTQKETLSKQVANKLFTDVEMNRSFESINMVGKSVVIDLNKEFMERTICLVRAYIVSAISLAQMDDDSLSDPYLVLRLGDQVQDNAKEYQTDKANCDFFKMFEFKTVLPGASHLQIQVWDKDLLVKDDLIGETYIDLENRYFSKRFRKLSNIPIETRPLYHPLSKTEKGRIKLWVEIIPVKNSEEVKMIWDLTPRPPCDYQLRVIVWDVENVPSQDIEDCSDLFVTALVGEKQQKTDTHFRAQNGAGSFNWRMLWDIVLPLKDPTITFQVWDQDFFSPNDFIAEATIKFKKEADSAYENENIEKIYGNKKVKIKQKIQGENNKTIEKEVTVNDEKFTIELNNCKKSGHITKETLGKLTISLELVPKVLADSNKVGIGRSEPNHSPWLPPPVGRFEFSWNPITLFVIIYIKNKCVGPKARKKVLICLCITICTVLLMYLLPTIIGGLLTTAIKKIF